MRDAIIERQKLLDRELRKAVLMAVETGELSGRTDAGQVVFDLSAIVMAYYRAAAVSGFEEAQRRAHAAFERLIRFNAA
jgi:hypothetical protein